MSTTTHTHSQQTAAPPRWLAIAPTVPLLIVTAIALAKVGYLGIFSYHFPSPAGWQVGLDLVCAIALWMWWMVMDARRTGRTVWPYLLLSLFGGSFGPLAYLIMRPKGE